MNISYIEFYRSRIPKALEDLTHTSNTLDTMRNVEMPALRAEYMQQVGELENTVLEAELEALMLQKKAKLMQIRRNQHQEIHSEEFDSIIETERSLRLANLNNRSKDEIWDVSISGSMQKATDSVQSFLSQLPEPSKNKESFEPDYTLAEKLFPCFDVSVIESGMHLLYEKITSLHKETLETIENARSIFPFNAEEMLHNPDKLAAYKQSLNLRLQSALLMQQNEKAKIQKLTDGI